MQTCKKCGLRVMQTGVIRTIDYPAHSPILRYTGEWDDDNRRPNGKGRMEYRNGDILEGEWKNGKKHGPIKYIYAKRQRDDNNSEAMAGGVVENDGDKFLHNIGKSEKWTRSAENEQTVFEQHEGEYKNGIPDGYGTLSRSRIRHVPGDVQRDAGYGNYKGYFEDGLPEGKGRMEYEDGRVYDGEWRDGMHHGKGIMKYPDRGRFEGEWRYGDPHGKGRRFFPNGDLLEGDFDGPSGLGNGYCTMQYANGDKYDGQWYDGQPNGHGIMSYANGDVYNGQWSHGQRVNGEIQYHDGTSYEGVWKNDAPSQ